jgi:hypothetical protein
VLLIRDVYPVSEFFHPGSRVKKIPDPFFTILDPRVEKASDPGSASATLQNNIIYKFPPKDNLLNISF